MASRPATYRPAYPATTSPHYPGINSPHYPDGNTGPVLPPGAPLLWFDVQDVNAGAAQPTDGAAVAIVKNKGSLGATWDVVQASGPAKPIFRAIATPGKINNLSALEVTGSQYLASVPTTVQAQPMTYIAICRNAGAGGVLFNGEAAANRNQVFFSGGAVALYAGGVAGTGKNIIANTWHSIWTTFNGAASQGAVDGSAGALIDPGAQGLSQMTLFTDLGGTFYTGFMAELLAYAGGSAPARAPLEAYIAAKYGATPQ